jgi:signal transduction histidine kinase
MKYQKKLILYSFLFVAFPGALLLLGVTVLTMDVYTPKDRTMISVLVFLAIMVAVCTYLIFRFDRQAGLLEKAARRIAEGDLDYVLEVQGDDEFSSVARSFERMRISLKEEQSKRFRFLMAVSHDLKTPLTSIKGYVEALQDGFADDPRDTQNYLRILKEKSDALEDRIKELIEFVKTETGDWRLRAARIYLDRFFSELVDVTTHDARILKRRFHYHLDIPGHAYVIADETLLVRVFENLLGNAIRYTQEGDSIRIEVRPKGKTILVSLRDTGIGIAQEDLPHIYDPFYRGTHSRREAGHGLGLSTVKNIIRSHDWKIECFSKEGKGTEFLIHLAPFFLDNQQPEV